MQVQQMDANRPGKTTYTVMIKDRHLSVPARGITDSPTNQENYLATV